MLQSTAADTIMHAGVFHCFASSAAILCVPWGRSPGKCIPLLGRHRETPTLTGTKFSKPYPYWHKSTKRVPSVAQLVFKNGLYSH